MLLFLMVGYVRHPRRIVRTLGALWTERSTSVVELRLVDMKRRGVAWLGRQLRRGARREEIATHTPEPAQCETVASITVEPTVRRVA
jgi:hypothetical protein